MKTILLALVMAVSVGAKADTLQSVLFKMSTSALTDVQTKGTFNFAVGDTAAYGFTLMTFQGTMTMTVKAINADTVTLNQDMAIMGQDQSCDIVLNPNTGAVNSMVCNGQNQTVPDSGTVTVVDSHAETITVPAGTFETLYVKANETPTGGGTASTVEQWINPKLVPVLGLVKTIAPSQMGTITMELTSFKKN